MKEISFVLKENNLEINAEHWSECGSKFLVRIRSIGHLKYDRFKQNYKNTNFVNQFLETLSSNIEEELSLRVENVCYYLAENY